MEDAAFRVRWMIRRDMPEVLEIERQSFEFSWTEEEFLKCLRQRTCIGMVVERQECVVGFMVYELWKSQLHVLSFAVAPWARRQGAGSQMINRLVDKLANGRRQEITLEVRETNLASQLFFKRLGFKATSVIRGHYERTAEDAYVMAYSMPQCQDQR